LPRLTVLPDAGSKRKHTIFMSIQYQVATLTTKILE
jgi:hypothetical protein